MARLTDTISGAIATFRTPGKQDIRSLKVHFTPVQEGTGEPSPENVRPITGWTGCEVYRGYEYLSNVQITTGKTLNASGLEATESGMAVTDYIPVEIGHTYMLKFTSTTAGRTRRIFGYSASKEPTSQLASVSWAAVGNTFSMNAEIPSDTSYIRACYYNGDIGKTLTEPSAVTTLPIDWTDSAGTVYGGYVDLVNGEVWETWKIDNLSTLSWSTRYNGEVNKTLSTSLTNSYSALAVDAPCICEQYNVINYVNGAAALSSPDGKDRGVFWCRNTGYTTTKALYVVIGKNDNPSGKIVYQLATPTLLTTLTPTALRTLIGTNNIWSNANGNVDVGYDFAESREMMEARKRAATFKWKPSRLPAGYKEVEFIAAKNATSNINMGFQLMGELEAEVHYYNSKNEAFVFGCRNNTSTPPYCNLNVEGSGSPAMTRFDYGTVKTTDSTQKFPFKLGEFIFTFHNRIAKLENLTGHTYTQVDFSSRTVQAVYQNLYLFAVKTGSTISKGDTNGTLAIYSAKFWLGGEPVRDYVPCVRKSDNVAGMYDLVSGQFYTDINTPFVTEL